MSSSPKRYGAPSEALRPPQLLAIPQEIMDSIMVALKSLHLAENSWGRLNKEVFIWDIKAFRLVCRTFNTGVFPYFTEQLSTSTFVFRLDEPGIDDIVHLSQSGLAPFVRRVQLADRSPSPHILTLSTLRWTDPAHEALRTEWYRNRSTKKQAAGDQRKLLLVTNPPLPRVGDSKPVKEHSERSTPFSLLRDPNTLRWGLRHYRQRDAFERKHAGWRPTWEPCTCQYLQRLSLSPSTFSLSRLATAFSSFTSLRSITTNEAYQIHSVAKDEVGVMMNSASFHGETNYFDYTGGRRIQCVCKDHGAQIRNPDYRCELSTRDIVWPAIAELGLLVDAIITPARLSFLSTLKELQLNIYDQVAITEANKIIGSHTDNIAKFIGHCRGLQLLELHGKPQRAIANTSSPLSRKIVPTFQEILFYFSTHNVQFPDLLKITLRGIGSKAHHHVLITDWLATHRTTLTEITLTIDFSSKSTERNLNCWLSLFETIAAAQRIRYIVLQYAFRGRRPGLDSRKSLRLDCHRSWTDNLDKIHDMFKTIAERLDPADSDFMGLQVWCTNQSDE